MTESHSNIWKPIEDLPEDWSSSLRNEQTLAMVQVWHGQADELQKKDLYIDFLNKLRREWSIETGVIEGIYSLTEGATKTLIEKGLDAALLTSSDTDQDPYLVIEKIKDHHFAIMGLYDFVSGKRNLGTSYIKELHAALTAHQKTYVAHDTLGNEVVRDLPHGEWKRMPNNVEHTDGSVFEYCPPEHVDQEIDNLIAMHEEHRDPNVPADIEAAWLHHRFSVIHPFTDGNGRVSRCLATLVMLRDNWLPLVVTRTDRPKYIESLRSADHGDLQPLVDFFGDIQRKAISNALSLSEEVIHESTEISGILASVASKFDERRRADEDLKNQAHSTADILQHRTYQRLMELREEIRSVIKNENEVFDAFTVDGNRNSEEAQHNYFQIINCARTLNYFANLHSYQSLASLIIKTDRHVEILFSFHGIGHFSSGIFGCTAMIYTKEKREESGTTIGEIMPLCDEPFDFTYPEDSAKVQKRFQLWQEEMLLKGLNEWRNLV